MTQTYWLSFADDTKHLGVAVVEISEEELVQAKEEVGRRFPHHLPGAEAAYAATRKAWEMGFNPGGEVFCALLPDGGKELREKGFPFHRLVQRGEFPLYDMEFAGPEEIEEKLGEVLRKLPPDPLGPEEGGEP